MPVPNQFGTATSAIPLSQLDANFDAPITIGNTAVQLGNTVTTLNNMTLANVTISSGTINITNVVVTTANVSGTANVSTLVVLGNETVGGNTTITGNITAAKANVTSDLVLFGGTANGVAYLNTSKQVTTGTALVFDGSNLGVGVTPSAWSGFRALQIGSTTSLWSGTSGNASSFYTNNGYYNGTNRIYLTNGFATEYIQGQGQHIWFNAPSGTANAVVTFIQAMTLDASGNLGIGTSSPAYKLDVNGDTKVANAVRYFVGATQYGVTFANAGAVGTEAYQGTYIYWGTGASTSATERMRLDASGNLLVGTTSVFGNAKATVSSSATDGIASTQGTAGGYCFVANALSNGGTYYLEAFTANGTSVGSITSNGTTTTYGVTSDQRLKENIKDAESASSMIDAIQVRQFDWKSDNSHQRYGFIAQELVTVAPEGVHQPADPDEMMAVDYSKLVPMLVKEIQSLRKRLAAAGI